MLDSTLLKLSPLIVGTLHPVHDKDMLTILVSGDHSALDHLEVTVLRMFGGEWPDDTYIFTLVVE